MNELNRTYSITIDGLAYEIKTIGLFLNEIYNQFTISKVDGVTLSITFDEDADGTLDAIKFGDFRVEEAQLFYNQLLERGLSDGMITEREGKFIVHTQTGDDHASTK